MLPARRRPGANSSNSRPAFPGRLLSGSAFKVGHDLEGKNLKLTKDRRIVQTWRANNWPKGTYSKATFAFARAAGGTRVTFTQTGVPGQFYGEISKGWREYYWTPLRKQFGHRPAKGR